jgi:hypothetical protein
VVITTPALVVHGVQSVGILSKRIILSNAVMEMVDSRLG